MTDPEDLAGWNAAEWAQRYRHALRVFYGLFPPMQCAPAIGVHQKCQHADRPRAHFTIDRDGTIRPDTRTDPT